MSSSCKGLVHDLAECIRRSPCMQGPAARDFHECLKAPEEDITNECQRIRYAYFECKRGQLDMRKRFRGNQSGLVVSSMLVYTFGRNCEGQLGLGSLKDEICSSPQLVESLRGRLITRVACGMKCSVALSATGDAFAFGYNGDGQLGIEDEWEAGGGNNGSNGDIVDSSNPCVVHATLVKSLMLHRASHGARIKCIACGDRATIVLCDDGLMFGYGDGSTRALLLERFANARVPLPRVILCKIDIKLVDLGAAHGLAVSSCGNVYAWGNGANGRLGLGDGKSYGTMRQISALVGIVHVVCGWAHSGALSALGQVFMWGFNQDGQLGIGHTNDALRPELVAKFAGKEVVALRAGHRHSAAIVDASQRLVYTWGLGLQGQLGAGNCASSTVPVEVASISAPVMEIACGGFHTLALTVERDLYAWGDCSYGQLGVGVAGPEPRCSPVLVPISGAHCVAAGFWHSCVLVPDEAANLLEEHNTSLDLPPMVSLSRMGVLEVSWDPAIPGSPDRAASPGLDSPKASLGMGHELALSSIVSGAMTLSRASFQKTGWLLKQGNQGVVRLWKKRFVCVLGASLVYYKDDTLAVQPQGAFLVGSVDVEAGVLCCTARYAVRVTRGGLEDSRDRVFLFRSLAVNNEEADLLEWKKVLLQMVAESSQSPALSQETERPIRKAPSFLQMLFGGDSPQEESVNDATMEHMERIRQAEKQEAAWRHEVLPSLLQMAAKGSLSELLVDRGVPASLRGLVWSKLIGNALGVSRATWEEASRSSFDMANRMREQSNSQLIRSDLPRTFPRLRLDIVLGPELLKLLQAFAVFRCDMGYVQGMSHVAAMLLMHMGVFDAFVALCNLLRGHFFESLFHFRIPECTKHMRVYELLFSKHLPELYVHLNKIYVSPEHYLLDWFLSLFSRSLPFAVAVRVWDCVMLDGEIFLFRTAVALMYVHERALLKASGLDEALPILRRMSDDISEETLFSAIRKITVPRYIRQFIDKIITISEKDVK